jgi:hypothetical protein
MDHEIDGFAYLVGVEEYIRLLRRDVSKNDRIARVSRGRFRDFV